MDAVVVGAALPVGAVTPYNLAQRLADGTRIAAEQFVKVLLPIATDMSASSDADGVRGLFVTATRLTLGLAVAVALPLIMFGGPVLELWVGPPYGHYGRLVGLLAASAAIDVAAYPGAAALQSFERHRPMAWMALVSGVLNVGLSVALVGPYGLDGVAAATLIATAGEILLVFFPYACIAMGVPLAHLARDVLLRLVVPVGSYGLLLRLSAAAVGVTSFAGLATTLCVSLAGYAALYMAAAAGRGERAAYRSARVALRAGVRRRRVSKRV
jgi:O-antigen/teichoic acid export membrane protein